MLARIRGFTEKKYHLHDNLWVCGFRSQYEDYDETVKAYELEKFRDNPRYLEIMVELNCSFIGSYGMIPIEIIGNFQGFEDDDMPKDSGWYLAICAKSKFLEQETDFTKRFNGPDKKWYEEAMIWWYQNEHNSFGYLCTLAINYTNYCLKERNEELLKKCKFTFNMQTFNDSIVRYILQKYNPYCLIRLANDMGHLEVLFLFYLIDASGFEYFLEYVETDLTSDRNRYEHERLTKVAEMVDTEMKKYL